MGEGADEHGYLDGMDRAVIGEGVRLIERVARELAHAGYQTDLYRALASEVQAAWQAEELPFDDAELLLRRIYVELEDVRRG